MQISIFARSITEGNLKYTAVWFASQLSNIQLIEGIYPFNQLTKYQGASQYEDAVLPV